MVQKPSFSKSHALWFSELTIRRQFPKSRGLGRGSHEHPALAWVARQDPSLRGANSRGNLAGHKGHGREAQIAGQPAEAIANIREKALRQSFPGRFLHPPRVFIFSLWRGQPLLLFLLSRVPLTDPLDDFFLLVGRQHLENLSTLHTAEPRKHGISLLRG
jgi:hypothetical protein